MTGTSRVTSICTSTVAGTSKVTGTSTSTSRVTSISTVTGTSQVKYTSRVPLYFDRDGHFHNNRHLDFGYHATFDLDGDRHFTSDFDWHLDRRNLHNLRRLSAASQCQHERGDNTSYEHSRKITIEHRGLPSGLGNA